MHMLSALYNLLHRSAPSIHITRLRAMLAAIQALTTGAQATVTSLGRGLAGPTFIKHKIKRIDRLLSNPHLYRERHFIYRALTRQLLTHYPRPSLRLTGLRCVPTRVGIYCGQPSRLAGAR
jgi:hypothetical protein